MRSVPDVTFHFSERHHQFNQQQGDNRMSGTTDEVKGRLKEAVGVVTDNHRLKVAGRRDQTIGKVKRAVERVIDKAKK
jgi:uncharacterized protein YjbJ (UPF0337 family)